MALRSVRGHRFVAGPDGDAGARSLRCFGADRRAAGGHLGVGARAGRVVDGRVHARPQDRLHARASRPDGGRLPICRGLAPPSDGDGCRADGAHAHRRDHRPGLRAADVQCLAAERARGSEGERHGGPTDGGSGPADGQGRDAAATRDRRTDLPADHGPGAVCRRRPRGRRGRARCRSSIPPQCATTRWRCAWTGATASSSAGARCRCGAARVVSRRGYDGVDG